MMNLIQQTMKSGLFLPVFCLSLSLSACMPDETAQAPKSGSSTYQVTATVGMIADIVREVAGDSAEVHGIIGEGVDPHLYKPTSLDVKALQAADIVFYGGLNLEGKMGDVLVRLARTGKPVYAVTEAILDEPDFLLSDTEAHYDPHVWMDVTGWKYAVEVVIEGLSGFDPLHASAYKSRGDAYRKKLDALDDYARQVLGSIPAEQRTLVTAHDAFNYMARAYGLEVRGIQGISTESEAGVKDIEDLVSFLVDKKIPAVFVESSVSDKNVRALIEGAQAKGHTVVIGGQLYSDAMGPAGTYEGTYIGMIDHNVTTIARALGGSAPESGMSGKLSPQ
jgi:manganese/zinc/iron transport system substrate-binding protein